MDVGRWERWVCAVGIVVAYRRSLGLREMDMQGRQDENEVLVHNDSFLLAGYRMLRGERRGKGTNVRRIRE